MKILRTFALSIAALSLGSAVASAQQQLPLSCRSDLQRLCSGASTDVTAQVACLRTHMGELSVSCKEEIMRAGEIPQKKPGAEQTP